MMKCIRISFFFFFNVTYLFAHLSWSALELGGISSSKKSLQQIKI